MNGSTSDTTDDTPAVREDEIGHVAEFLGFNPYQATDFPPVNVVETPAVSSPQGLGSTARPTRLPKAPKGRMFVGVILLAVFSFIGYQVWNSFLRFGAYGTVEGHTIDVHPPWDGAVEFLHVEEGSRVRQGQLLATVHNIELEHRLEQLADELRVALATLESEHSKLTWQASWNSQRHQDGVSEYYEAWGEFLKEQALLSELSLSLDRAERLMAAGANSQHELDEIQLQYHGQKESLEKLKIRLGELKKQVDSSVGMISDGTPQLKPLLAKIDLLQGESERVRERLDQGHVKSPADGIVVHRPRLVGERCTANEPLLTILQDGSLEVVLYVPQQTAHHFVVGDEIEVKIDPYPSAVKCTVTRCGNALAASPRHLERYCHQGENLLPIYLRPHKAQLRWIALRIGGLVKLPSRVVPRFDAKADASAGGTP